VDAPERNLMDEVCEGCGEEGGNHAADCFTWERGMARWAPSVAAAAASTSYEDYLRRVAELS
jgi:hypothetical protein